MNNEKITFSPNQLNRMSEDHIAVLFHSDNWNKLSTECKLNICQEVENRLAASDNIEPRTVVAEKMNGATYGYQQGNKIAVNADLIEKGVFTTTYTNQNGEIVTTEHRAPAENWNTYNTIVHEHTHGANMDNGISPFTYISSKSDYNLYRIQNEEKSAYEAGDLKGIAMLQKAEAILGKEDANKAEYFQSIAGDSYEKCLEEAKLRFNDPNIDKTLEQFINDRENGIVRNNASPSYKQISAIYDSQIQKELESYLNNTGNPAKEQEVSNSVHEEAYSAINVFDNTYAALNNDSTVISPADTAESVTTEAGSVSAPAVENDSESTAATSDNSPEASSDNGIDGGIDM